MQKPLKTLYFQGFLCGGEGGIRIIFIMFSCVFIRSVLMLENPVIMGFLPVLCLFVLSCLG